MENLQLQAATFFEEFATLDLYGLFIIALKICVVLIIISVVMAAWNMVMGLLKR